VERTTGVEAAFDDLSLIEGRLAGPLESGSFHRVPVDQSRCPPTSPTSVATGTTLVVLTLPPARASSSAGGGIRGSRKGAPAQRRRHNLAPAPVCPVTSRRLCGHRPSPDPNPTRSSLDFVLWAPRPGASSSPPPAEAQAQCDACGQQNHVPSSPTPSIEIVDGSTPLPSTLIPTRITACPFSSRQARVDMRQPAPARPTKKLDRCGEAGPSSLPLQVLSSSHGPGGCSRRRRSQSKTVGATPQRTDPPRSSLRRVRRENSANASQANAEAPADQGIQPRITGGRIQPHEASHIARDSPRWRPQYERNHLDPPRVPCKSAPPRSSIHDLSIPSQPMSPLPMLCAATSRMTLPSHNAGGTAMSRQCHPR
jgi:hypothetical protein